MQDASLIATSEPVGMHWDSLRTLSRLATPICGWLPYGEADRQPGTDRSWIFRAGCFRRSIAEQNVTAFFDHSDEDPRMELGNLKERSLLIEETPWGLAFELLPPDNPLGRNMVFRIKHGLIRECSLRWRPRAWAERGRGFRDVYEAELREINILPPHKTGGVPGTAVWIGGEV